MWHVAFAMTVRFGTCLPSQEDYRMQSLFRSNVLLRNKIDSNNYFPKRVYSLRLAVVVSLSLFVVFSGFLFF